MRISHLDKRLVVITGGDPSGIGPEVIIKALAEFPFKTRATPLIIGDYRIFQKNARILGIKNFDIKKYKADFIDLANVSHKKFKFGTTSRIYGRASMEYILRGISIVKAVRGASLVTAPINKASIQKAGFKFAGHTEFLSRITKSSKVTMMLVGKRLRISLVTRHIPHKDVAGCITKANIVDTVKNTHYALRKFFKIASPKIGVAGLNPHAGEKGFLGREEDSIIVPALNHLKRKIKGITGPSPADTLFYKAYHGRLDAVVCMYHDQGLVPFKMVAFDEGVNLTIGLPFIRTSPDHGTGFDIAGKGKANPSSMIEAIKLAFKLSARC